MTRKKFSDMQTPEQRYAAQQAPALEQRARDAGQTARKEWMSSVILAGPGPRHDAAKARAAQQKAGHKKAEAERLKAEADAARNAARPSRRRGLFG